MTNTILCVKWGDKYDRTYVEKLREQVEKYCSVPYKFYCLTDNPEWSYDIPLSNEWNNRENGNFWAYRKLFMFNYTAAKPSIGSTYYGHRILGDKFLYLDLDVIIHQDLKYFFELPMDNPYIVRGWWNDMEECHKNYAKFRSTPINSSVIRWDKGQMDEVFYHIKKHIDVIFFTYPTIDNYLNHFWYDMHFGKDSYFDVFPEGDIYSWYKGNTFPHDMEARKVRKDCKICLFNNSAEMNDVSEIKPLWDT